MNHPSLARDRRRTRIRCGFLLGAVSAAVLLAACGGADGPAASEWSTEIPEDDHPAPVDYGTGPVTPAAQPLRERAQALAMPSTSVNGGPKAAIRGAFGQVFPFPIIPLHMVMLPDGRILAYGTDETGKQGAQLVYVVFDPSTPEGQSPFQVLPNGTGTDLFCSAHFMLPDSGKVMLAGGDRSINGVRNYAVNDVNVFNPQDNSLTRQTQSMAYRRWYGTAVPMPNGDHVMLGGRDDVYYAGSAGKPATVQTYSVIPEVYSTTTGWRTLSNAGSDAAFGGTGSNYWYPKAWVAGNGKVAVLTNGNDIYTLDPDGRGTLQTWAPSSGKMVYANANQPAVMYEPGKILAARNGTRAQVVDIGGEAPTVRDTNPLSVHRRWGSMTLLPNGQVWASGGAKDSQNVLESAVYTTELWTPGTETWTWTVNATKPRLYHGNAILLPDGSVLTGGGGAPGPVRGLNAEIFYPPYLFKKDGSGELAPKPQIVAISDKAPTWSQAIAVQMANKAVIQRVSLMRLGSATHSFDPGQRLLPLQFTQVNRDLQITMPSSRIDAPPGFYMLFVLNDKGVPSIAQFIKLG